MDTSACAPRFGSVEPGEQADSSAGERRSHIPEVQGSTPCPPTTPSDFRFYDFARFFSKVEVGRVTECWPWRGATGDKGYGRFKIGSRLYLPHRVAYEILNGPIPAGDGYHGTVIRHRCDNPPCCNPYHLVAGTQSDNVKDMYERGRNHFGKTSRLDPEIVERIINDPRPHRVIAADLGVAASYVGKIKRGEALKWLREEADEAS